MIIKDKYLLDFLKFVASRENVTLRSNDIGKWDIYFLEKKIGSFLPSGNRIQIFENKMFNIIVDYFQLGFGHDVFIVWKTKIMRVYWLIEI